MTVVGATALVQQSMDLVSRRQQSGTDVSDGAAADDVPAVEHAADRVENSLGERLCSVAEVEKPPEISDQVRPAELSTLGMDPVVGSVAVGHCHAAKFLGDE